MQIEFNNNLSINQAAANAENAQKANSGKAVKPNADQDNAVLQSEFSSLIEQAMTQDEDRALKVAEAAKALEDGSLDTTESYRAAAENMLTFGI